MTPKEQRDVLVLFQTKMREVFENNIWKGGWERDTPASLLAHVYEELREVEDELVMAGTKFFDLDKLEVECADVAVMACILASRMRMIEDQKKKQGDSLDHGAQG
jgi:NTP pyrophosphatase (non-canonical NTP hydrolase)